MIEQDDEGNAVRLPALSADVGLSAEDQPFVYRAGARGLDSVHSSSVKRREQSSSLMTFRRQGKKETRTSFDEGLKGAAESVAKVKNLIGVTLAAFGTLQPEAELAFQVFKAAMREYCVVKDTSFNELENLHDLETGSALHQNTTLVLADTRDSTCSAQGQMNYAHDAICREEIEDAVRLMGSVMAFGAHGHFLL